MSLESHHEYSHRDKDRPDCEGFLAKGDRESKSERESSTGRAFRSMGTVAGSQGPKTTAHKSSISRPELAFGACSSSAIQPDFIDASGAFHLYLTAVRYVRTRFGAQLRHPWNSKRFPWSSGWLNRAYPSPIFVSTSLTGRSSFASDTPLWFASLQSSNCL